MTYEHIFLYIYIVAIKCFKIPFFGDNTPPVKTTALVISYSLGCNFISLKHTYGDYLEIFPCPRYSSDSNYYQGNKNIIKSRILENRDFKLNNSWFKTSFLPKIENSDFVFNTHNMTDDEVAETFFALAKLKKAKLEQFCINLYLELERRKIVLFYFKRSIQKHFYITSIIFDKLTKNNMADYVENCRRNAVFKNIKKSKVITHFFVKEDEIKNSLYGEALLKKPSVIQFVAIFNHNAYFIEIFINYRKNNDNNYIQEYGYQPDKDEKSGIGAYGSKKENILVFVPDKKIIEKYNLKSAYFTGSIEDTTKKILLSVDGITLEDLKENDSFSGHIIYKKDFNHELYGVKDGLITRNKIDPSDIIEYGAKKVEDKKDQVEHDYDKERLIFINERKEKRQFLPDKKRYKTCYKEEEKENEKKKENHPFSNKTIKSILYVLCMLIIIFAGISICLVTYKNYKHKKKHIKMMIQEKENQDIIENKNKPNDYYINIDDIDR
ncbi:hypothetical protein EHP00_2584 [Ecytonucleospora hepatopenaei]|uniref:Uncharacterized protein n=1 Tax=Ecytonucleospora hepatopenaei TaxID=646526 RepID=A0A1W0E4Z9_9MICR|nr:hypothetical protein EHP00_1203 [Ecytonucleospora hepatopenaei]OQS55402.1 hypothetical protein EHP00_2584 [Ecytonucleospora hepatopenaei]